MLQTKPKIKIQFLSYLGELFNEKWRYIILYGGRSGGKSRAVAEALLLRGRNKQLRILCTREVQNTIKDSVHKLLSDLIEEYGFDDYSVTKDSVVNSVTGTEFIFRGLHRNITEIKSTEGVDICWIEEGQAVTKESLDIITPTIRKPGSQIIVTFNRVDELDPVYVHYVLNRKPNSYVLKINYDVLEEAGLLPDVIKSEIEGDRSDPELFAHKWLGEPISQGEFSIIPRTEILNAMQRDTEGDGAVIIGVDVARMGDDRTVFWKRKGLKTLGFEVYQHKRTTEVCDLLERFAETKDGDADISKTIDIKIDDTGVGGGVTDEMKKRGYNALPVNFGGRPNNNNKYPNLISEAWFELAEVIREVELPMNNDLVMELSTRQWHQDNKGKRAIESKQDYKKRGFRSPDLADACIICYYSGKKRIKAFTAKPSGW
jgi:phage terminase large subunit